MEPTVRSTWLWEPASLCRRACLSSPVGHYQETWLLGLACLADLIGSGPRPSEPPRFYTEVLILLLPSSCSLFQGLHPSLRLLQRAHVRHSFPESTAGLGHVQCPAWVPFPAPRPWGSPLPSPALTSPPINGGLGQILKHHSRLAAPAQRQTRPCTYVCLQMTIKRKAVLGSIVQTLPSPGNSVPAFTGDTLVARTVLHCLYQSDIHLSNSYRASSTWLGS